MQRVVVLVAVLLAGGATLPPLDGRSTSRALDDTAATRLGRAVASDVAAHPGKSGIHPIPTPADAFAARIVLAASVTYLEAVRKTPLVRELLRNDLALEWATAHELRPFASVEGIKPRSGLGSSASVQLHAKTFAVDRARIFVGSFNFDPRSAHLNTEMGLVIDSPVLTQRLATALDADFASKTYEPRVASDGRRPVWIARTEEGTVTYDVEPESSAGQRALIELLQVLPIEWLL